MGTAATAQDRRNGATGIVVIRFELDLTRRIARSSSPTPANASVPVAAGARRRVKRRTRGGGTAEDQREDLSDVVGLVERGFLVHPQQPALERPLVGVENHPSEEVRGP